MSVFYNIRAQFVEDVPYLIDLTRLHKPRWALVMDGVGLAAELKAASPTTNVIHRAWPDDVVNLSPKDWLTKKKNELQNKDLWAYTYNEIGLQVDWTIELIKESARQGWPVKLVVGNVSTGTPQPEQWSDPKVIELLKLLDIYREHVVLGLHEYAHGVITSGLQDKNFETNLALWPAKIEPSKNNWHCGRFKFILQSCDRNGIKYPRIVITEHGFDNLGDMVGKLPGGGWLTLHDYWVQIFAGKDMDDAYALQLIYANRVIYAYGNAVEGQLVFQYGGKPSGLWNAFNVEGHKTLHTKLAENEGAVIPTDPRPPGVTKEPFQVVIAAADKAVPVRFRRTPSLEDINLLGYIKDPVLVWRLADDIVRVGNWSFQKFNINGQDGWAALELLLIKTPEEAAQINLTLSEFVDLQQRMRNLKIGLIALSKQAEELDAIISALDEK